VVHNHVAPAPHTRQIQRISSSSRSIYKSYHGEKVPTVALFEGRRHEISGFSATFRCATHNGKRGRCGDDGFRLLIFMVVSYPLYAGLEYGLAALHAAGPARTIGSGGDPVLGMLSERIIEEK
jgi:hypothetical protein